MNLYHSKFYCTASQHDDIYLEDYLIENLSQFKLQPGSKMNQDQVLDTIVHHDEFIYKIT